MPVSISSIPIDFCYPGTGWKQMDRLEKQTGVLIAQSDVTSISYEICDTGDNAVMDHGSLVTSSVIFNSPVSSVSDPDWTITAYGYNFMTIWPPTTAAPASRTYRYKIKIVLSDGSVFYFARDRQAIDPGGYL